VKPVSLRRPLHHSSLWPCNSRGESIRAHWRKSQDPLFPTTSARRRRAGARTTGHRARSEPSQACSAHHSRVHLPPSRQAELPPRLPETLLFLLFCALARLTVLSAPGSKARL